MYDTKNPNHDFNYEYVLSFANGMPAFRIVELGLIATAADVEGAFREMTRLKQEYLDKARAADLLDTLPRPSRHAGGVAASAVISGTTVLKGDIPTFLIKLGIVCAVFVIVIGGIGIAVRSSLHVPVGKKFWTMATDELHRAAEGNGMNAEVQSRVQADIHTLVARYKPIVDELRPLFSDPAPKPNVDQK